MALHKPVIKWGICIVKRPQKFDYQAFVVDMSKDLSFLRSRCSGNPLNVIIPAGTQLRESQYARARAKLTAIHASSSLSQPCHESTGHGSKFHRATFTSRLCCVFTLVRESYSSTTSAPAGPRLSSEHTWTLQSSKHVTAPSVSSCSVSCDILPMSQKRV